MGEKIALVGCGAGNAALVAHMARLDWTGIESIVLIDPRKPARGTAFDHDEEYLLCNTSVAVNSIFPDDALHFLRWLSQDMTHSPHWGVRAQSIDQHSFVPRGLFRAYIASEFEKALAAASARGVTTEHIASTADSIERTFAGVTVTTEDGLTVEADRAVVATGLRDSAGAARRARSAGGLLWSAYDTGRNLERLKRARTVLVLGMRQSAIDVAQLVHEFNPNAEIVMASRTGRLPGVRSEMVELPSDYITASKILDERGSGAPGSPERWNALLFTALRDENEPSDADSALFPQLLPDPIAQLKTDLAHTRAGRRSWQRVDRNGVTVANQVWPNLTAAQREQFRSWFVGSAQRYVSAVPEVVADRLVSFHLEGRLVCAQLGGEPRFSDGHVDAYTNLGALRTDVAIDATGKTPATIGVPDSERIFALGPANRDSLAIPNYFNAAARQAATLARTLTNCAHPSQLQGQFS